MQRKNWVKKGIMYLLCVALLLAAAWVPETAVYAADEIVTFTENGLEFKIMDDTALTVTIRKGVDFPGGDLPDTVTYGGRIYTVTWISREAFKDYTENITKLPAGLTSIGEFAFENCTGLTVEALPETVTWIQQEAFSGCTNLALTSLPENVKTIEKGAFKNCSNLALTKLPSGLTGEIPYTVFENCKKLALTELPEGITSIGNRAFSGCTNLALTSLPEGVTGIGYNAFYQCTNLALTNLPEGVKNIGNSAFFGCTELALTGLPSTVTAIGEAAFGDCAQITISSLPEGITEIGDYTFRGCTSLTEMVIPEGVTTLGFEAFRGCTNLVTVSLPASLITIDNQVFQECSRLELTSLPPNVTTVGYQAFWDCRSITYMVLGDNITSFSYQCFSSGPDMIVSENSTTKATLDKNDEDTTHAKQGTVVTTWSGTQDGLNANDSSYINTNLTVDGDLTLAAGKKLVITSGGTMTITGNLVVESGGEVLVDAGGRLIVEGTITNNGTITNKGTIIIDNGTIANNGTISSPEGEISGSDNITGNEALTAIITLKPYTGNYDTYPHPAITEIIGKEEGDIVSYSTDYVKNESNPEKATWSLECPEYTTVKDARTPVAVKVERVIKGQQKVIAIETATVVIQKVKLEIIELPQASPVTEGDILNQSELTGGKVVIKGTEIEIPEGRFYWSSLERETVLWLKDSGTTAYGIFYSASSYDGYSTDTVSDALTVIVNECHHENTEREYQEERPSTCTEKGATAATYCKQCRRLLEGNEELPLAEHSWDEGKVTAAPTTESTGEKVYTCTVCGETKTEILPKTDGNTGGDTSGNTGSGDNTGNGGSGDNAGNGEDAGNGVEAELPSIIENPADGTYGYQEEAVLRVEAAVSDGGTVSYQWYQNSARSTQNAMAINGAVGREYRASTAKLGTVYYFCKVTNTNPKAAGTKTASVNSGIAEITVVKAANPITKVDEYKKAIGSKVTLKAAGKTTYKVKDKKIATVTKKGKVTFKKYGTTTITVKAKGNAYYKAATKKIRITVTPKKVSISKASSKKAKTMVVRWKQDKSVTGYQLAYATNSKFKGAKKVTLKGAKTNSATVQKLKAGKKYYVRVRAYKKVGNKTIYGDWSKTKTVKIKK